MTSKETINCAVISGILNETSFTKGTKTLSILKVNKMNVNIFWNKSKNRHYNQLLGKKVLILGRFAKTYSFNKKNDSFDSILGIKVDNMEVVEDDF